MGVKWLAIVLGIVLVLGVGTGPGRAQGVQTVGSFCFDDPKGQPDIAQVVSAVQTQVDRDLVPVWQMRVDIHVTCQDGDWRVFFNPDTSAPYCAAHGLDDMSGEPAIIVDLDTKHCGSWSWGFSHEILEAAIDPYTDLRADNGNGRLMVKEIADPVQDQGYMIGSVLVSDFVTPSWFDPKGLAPFDFMLKLSSPWSVTKDGYIPWVGLKRPSCVGGNFACGDF